MLVRFARGLYLLFVVAMIAFYAVSAGTSAQTTTAAPSEPQDSFEWC